MGMACELDSLVSGFLDAQALEQAAGFHHLFDHPLKSDVVRLADKAQCFYRQPRPVSGLKAGSLMPEGNQPAWRTLTR